MASDTQEINEHEFAATHLLSSTKVQKDQKPIAKLTTEETIYTVFPGITTIGRDPECDIAIKDGSVSRKHAQIEAKSDGAVIFLKDLESCNKTRINNFSLRALSNYQINDGDQITFGDTVGVFKLYKKPARQNSVEDFNLRSIMPHITINCERSSIHFSKNKS